MDHDKGNLALMSTMVNTPKLERVHESLGIPHWKLAMEAKYDAFMKNGIWELVYLPPDNKTIGCKKVFKIKYKVDGLLISIRPN